MSDPHRGGKSEVSRLGMKKIILSIFIVVHLVVVLSVPNQHSYLNEKMKPFLIFYANLLHVNHLWQFFSPDPAPAIFYEYTVTDKDQKREKYYFPDIEPPNWWNPFQRFRPAYNRRITLTRVTVQHPSFFEKIIVPMLCRNHPEAVNIDMNAMSTKFPSLRDVSDGRPLNDMEQKEYKNMGEFSCYR